MKVRFSLLGSRIRPTTLLLAWRLVSRYAFPYAMVVWMEACRINSVVRLEVHRCRFGYFCMAVLTPLLMRRFEYRAGILAGTTLLSAGMLLFWPAGGVGQLWFVPRCPVRGGMWVSDAWDGGKPVHCAVWKVFDIRTTIDLAQAFNPRGLSLEFSLEHSSCVRRRTDFHKRLADAFIRS